MAYYLGIDIGTTYTAAPVSRRGLRFPPWPRPR